MAGERAVAMEEVREAAGTGAAARAMEETARVVVGRGRAGGAAEGGGRWWVAGIVRPG